MRRARRVLAVPEGHSCRRARRRRDDHAIVLDRVDAPRRRAELKHVADARLVHELLVQFAESRAIGEIDGVEAAVGNRAAGNDRDHARAARRGERVADAIPAETSVELRRDVGRILPRQHRQHFVERRARECVVRIRAADEIEERRARPIVVDRRRRRRSPAPARRARSARRASARRRRRASRARRRASPARRRGTSARTRRGSPRRASVRRGRRAAVRWRRAWATAVAARDRPSRCRCPARASSC